MKKQTETGFTLTELIITLAIAGIFLTIAVPGYYTLVQNNKAGSMVNKLASSINHARMEAIKRGVRVSVCPSASAALNACGTVGQWGQGWVVFVDANNDNIVNSNNDLLKVQEALPDGTSAVANNAVISYDGSGFLTSSAFTITLSATGCSGNNARRLAVSASGRVTIANATCP